MDILITPSRTTFKATCLSLFILTAGFFVLAYFRGPLTYWFYGFDPALIGSSSPQTYIAYNATQPLSNLIFCAAILVAFVTMTISVVAIYLRVYVRYYFSHLVLLVTILLLVIYALAATLPKRVV